jgi:fused signal recognition particle receptor
MFGSNDDQKTPAKAGEQTPGEPAAKKSLFGWMRKKPQNPEPPAAEPQTPAPVVPPISSDASGSAPAQAPTPSAGDATGFAPAPTPSAADVSVPAPVGAVATAALLSATPAPLPGAAPATTALETPPAAGPFVAAAGGIASGPGEPQPSSKLLGRPQYPLKPSPEAATAAAPAAGAELSASASAPLVPGEAGEPDAPSHALPIAETIPAPASAEKSLFGWMRKKPQVTAAPEPAAPDNAAASPAASASPDAPALSAAPATPLAIAMPSGVVAPAETAVSTKAAPIEAAPTPAPAFAPAAGTTPTPPAMSAPVAPSPSTPAPASGYVPQALSPAPAAQVQNPAQAPSTGQPAATPAATATEMPAAALAASTLPAAVDAPVPAGAPQVPGKPNFFARWLGGAGETPASVKAPESDSSAAPATPAESIAPASSAALSASATPGASEALAAPIAAAELAAGKTAAADTLSASTPSAAPGSVRADGSPASSAAGNAGSATVPSVAAVTGDAAQPGTPISPSTGASAEPSKLGFFSRLKLGLAKTSASLGEGMASLFLGQKEIDDDLFDEIETRLLTADVGVEATNLIIQSLTQRVARKQLTDSGALYKALQEELTALLRPVEKPLVIDAAHSPFVILVVGVNGAGKTTTIGKLAKKLQLDGKKVMLAAGDTFRAAAVEQLQVWGERNQIAVIAQHTGADSASVIFDAVQAAKARGMDVLIADTAGRLHTKDNLMEELKKVRRVIGKLDSAAPHEVLLVLDAGTGQNAINQTKQFNQTVNLTGLALTKLDGTAKGGVIFALAKQFGLPIRYIGMGEGIDDLRTFEAEPFVQALFAERDQP